MRIIPSKRFISGISKFFFIFFLLPSSLWAGEPGDVNGDGQVCITDYKLLIAARNQPASGPDDPRDIDGDGIITVLDARKLILLCDQPRCVCSEVPQNQAPTANAGSDRTLTLDPGQAVITVMLDGSASDDPDGTITSYVWSGTPNPGDTIQPEVDLGVGTHTFTLVVTDDDGQNSNPDSVTITVEAPNQVPVADAGDDAVYNLASGQTNLIIDLDGSGSSDPEGSPLTYTWSGAPDPEDISNPSVELTAGEYTFSLVVTDALGLTSVPDDVTIIVNEAPNQPPVADAGEDQVHTLSVGQTQMTITLDGSASTDPDGTVSAYLWSGTYDPDDVMTPAISLGEGTYEFSLVVVDSLDLESESDTVSIIINPAPDHPPVLSVSPAEYTVNEGDELVFDVSATDADGDEVTLSAAPLLANSDFTPITAVDPTTPYQFLPDYDQAGAYTVKFTAADTTGLVDEVSVSITVVDVNRAPTADTQGLSLEEDQSIGITLTGSDPDQDELSFMVISDPNYGTVSGTPPDLFYTPNPDYYGPDTFEFGVEDENGDSDIAVVSISVIPVNDPPVANAGTDQHGTIGGALTLNGTNSTDVDGDELEFMWTIDTAPENSSASLINPYAPDPLLIPDLPGTYTIQLVVYDGFEYSQPDTVSILVTGGALQLNPSTLNLITLASGTLTVTLAEPAGPGGQAVDLTSSNPSIAAVTDSVTIAEDETSITFEVTTLVSEGTATITASAEGIGEDSATVNVSLRELELSVFNPLIGTERTSQATIGLDLPAPAGGTILSLNSSASAIAGTSTDSIEIAEDESTAVFQINGLAVGEADISVSAPGYAPASTTVFITEDMILIGILETLAPDQVGSLPIILSKPAPPGGVTVSLTSSNPAVASVSPNVFVHEGETIASANAQVTGVSFGNVTITASAPGYAPDYAELPVTFILTFTPSYVYVTAGETENITLGLSAPAPSTGLTLNLTSSNTSLTTVPAGITVPSGQSSVQVPVTGVAQGTTQIHAGAPGIESVSATVQVTSPPAIEIYDFTVHYNLQQRTSFYLREIAPAGGVTVTLTSSDPSRVILSKSAVTVGSESISFNVSAGGYTEIFYIQSLADSGNVEIMASASGYADASSQITLAPTGFWIGNGPSCPASCYDSFEVSSFDSNYTLNIGVRTPSSTQRIRAGITIEVPIVSSNPSVGVFTQDSVAFSQDQYRLNTQFDPLAAGTTTLSVIQPPGFSTQAAIQTEVTANVVAPAVELTSNMIVGENLQKYLDYRLGGYPPGPVDVTAKVEDESVAIISADPEAAGAKQITLNDVDITNRPAIYVQGISQGTTEITVSVTGYTSATCTIEVYPSGFYFNKSSSFDMFVSETEYVSIGVAALSPGTLHFYERQDIRGGLSVPVEVTSSNPEVGKINFSPIEFPAGTSSGSFHFEALAAGSSTISMTPPDGFSIQSGGYPYQLTANVSALSVYIDGSVIINNKILIGRDLQTSEFYYRMDAYPPEAVEVTFRVDDSSIALISNIRNEVGGQSISVTEQYPNNVKLYLQGLKEGNTTLTVSAPGYLSSTYPIEVLPSGFVFMQPYSNFTTNVFAENTRVTVLPGFLYPETHEYYGWQEIRAGLTVNVPVVSSDTRVGVITESPLNFFAGLYPKEGRTYFDPVAGGSTIISVNQPDGFTEPANNIRRTATVEAPDIKMKSDIRVGKNLQDILVINLESTPPVPVDVIVSVVDPNVAIISDVRTATGSSSVTFHNVSDTSALRVYVQGLTIGDTELRAQAIGFNDAVTEVAVDPSALYIAWPYNNFEADAADPDYEVNVFTAQLDRTTLIYGTNNSDESSCWLASNCITIEENASHPEIRGGLTLYVPIQSSDPSVGLLAASSLTFIGGQDNRKIVELDLVGSGDVEISITPPTGFSLPADRNTRILGTVRGIGSSPPLEAYMGRIYSYDVEASHPAADHIFLLTTAPTGMTIDETTGMIQWKPEEESQLGDHTVTVELNDDDGLIATQSFTLSVLEVDPNNRAPMIISGPVKQAIVEMPYIYNVKAFDNDEGEVLSYSLTTAPDEMSIDAVTGVVEWTPDESQIGGHLVILTVQDVAEASATQRFMLTVLSPSDLDQDFDGFTINDGDCNDADPFINPGETDVADNDIDENCDGEDASTSIIFKAGSETISIPVGTSAYVGYTFDFKTVDPGEYNFEIDEQISPNTDGVTIKVGLPGIISATGSKWSTLGQQVFGNNIGTYELTTTVTLQETGDMAQSIVTIEVTEGEDVPVLKLVGSDPDAIPIADEQDVIFTVFLTNTRKVPDAVILEKIDASGNPVADLGELTDDGSQGDLSAGDLVYSGTFSLFSETEGELHFRARAIFDGGAETYMADQCIVGVTRFPIDLESPVEETVVTHPETGNPMVSNRVTVFFVDGTSSDTIESIVEEVNGTIIGTVYRLGLYSVEVTDTGDATGVLTAVETLLTHPEVEAAEPVSVGLISASPIVIPNDYYFTSNQYHEYFYREEPFYMVRADEAWLISRGGSDDSAPVIAIIDTGVDLDHPDLRNKFTSRHGTNYHAPRNSSQRKMPRDDNGHGTAVAGIAAAETNNGIGMAGMAWNSPILVYKLLGTKGAYDTETTDFSAAAIRSAADRGAKIINMSYGGYVRTIAEARAVAYANERGALLIAAAGNDGDSALATAPNYPAAFEEVIAVSAIEAKLSPTTGSFLSYGKTSYSNHGSYVDIAAPAPEFSTIPLDRLNYAFDITPDLCQDATKATEGCYVDTLSGTSFSAPMVSGAAALLWSDRPWLNNTMVRFLLQSTAVPMPGTGLGAGRLDVFEALFNGSFETDWRAGWIAEGLTGHLPESSPADHAVVSTINSISLGGGMPDYSPVNHPVRGRGQANRKMVYVGNDGGDISQTTLSRTFTVQPGVTEIPLSMDFYFISEEVPEYLMRGECGRCNCNIFWDSFEIKVTAPNGENIFRHEKFTFDYEIESGGWNIYSSSILNIGEPGCELRPYDLGSYLYGTPLSIVCPILENVNAGIVRSSIINQPIPVSGGPGEYTISISIFDWTDEVGDSAIVIDNIRFRPE